MKNIKNIKSEKGAITILVLVSVLFFVSFLVSGYMVVSNKIKGQKEIIEQTRKIYETETAEDAYKSFFNNDSYIPIYTAEQFRKIRSGELVNINGKIYTFGLDKTYVLMNDLPTGEKRGTIINPIPIYTAEQFRKIGSGETLNINDKDYTFGLDGTYLIMNNIDLGAQYNAETQTWEGIAFETIGYYNYKQSEPFIGIIEGFNNTISGIYIKNQSIIGHNKGTIQNIILDNGYIDSECSYSGTVAGCNDGTIKNVYNKGISVNSSSNNYTGGLVGLNNIGTIENCYNNANVSGISMIGGIVGQNNANISNCYNTAKIGGQSHVAGLIGLNTATAKLSNSYNTGTVISTVSNGAGVVGQNKGIIEVGYNFEGIITRTYNIQIIEGDSTIGGISGTNAGEISNSYNTNEINCAIKSAGGICGTNTNIVRNCYNEGTVTAVEERCGGTVGYNTGTVTLCYNTGKIISSKLIGGIVGYNYNGTVTENYNIGNIQNATSYVGAIIGRNYNGTVTNCYYLSAIRNRWNFWNRCSRTS